MNSYRLPHGAREAATARATTANPWARVAMSMIATAIFAAGRLTDAVYSISSDTNARGAGGSSMAGPPAPASCLDRSVASSASSFFTERSKRSEEHTSELQSRGHLVCRLLLEK